MTTLVAKNETDSNNVNLSGFHLKNGDVLLIGNKIEIEKASDWMIKNGISNVYFNPEGAEYKFTEFMISDASGQSTITLYN